MVQDDSVRMEVWLQVDCLQHAVCLLPACSLLALHPLPTSLQFPSQIVHLNVCSCLYWNTRCFCLGSSVVAVCLIHMRWYHLANGSAGFGKRSYEPRERKRQTWPVSFLSTLATKKIFLCLNANSMTRSMPFVLSENCNLCFGCSCFCPQYDFVSKQLSACL